MRESPEFGGVAAGMLCLDDKDPPSDAVAAAMAQALCRLAHLDPRLSAAKPAGRMFASLILVTCIWAVTAIFLLVDTRALAWVVMTLALWLSAFRLWACCVPEPRVSFNPEEDTNGTEPVWTILCLLRG